MVEAGFTVITLDKSLDHAYVRHTVTIRANVAPGTHGESVEEILGSGDSAQPFQRFTLRQPPLTYISAATSSGSETTLEIRVNGLLWQEVRSFYGRGPEERIYITRTDDDGRTTVMFGDGLSGARLPTGQENVKAKYRKGTGLSGLVKDNQLSQLMTKPLGVKEVTNPIASSGAADREGRDEARRNAPLTVLTMGRIVSLQDYEAFARTFAGIDKALATSCWISQRRGVFVTVAGSKGAIVKSGSTLYENLLTALRTAGDPFVPFVVASYVPLFFQLHAKIQVTSEYPAEKVLPSVEEKLRTGFSFDVREFGQPVALSEVISVIQNVAGVKSVTVAKLYRSDEAPDVIPHPLLEASIPKPDDDEIIAAELLTLDPRPVGLEELP
jgi:predicted phage baseplate assembly protein